MRTATLLALLLALAAPVRSQVVLVHDLRPGPASSGTGYMAVLDGALYFTADDGVHGAELWRTDGTTATLVADIRPGPEGSGFSPYKLYVLNDRLYFIADDGIHGSELWVTDGADTHIVVDARSGPGSQYGSFWFGTDGTRLFFDPDDGVHGREPWVVEGDSARLLADIRPGPGSSGPEWLTRVGDRVYFSASDSLGRELWTTDGTTAALVADIWPGSEGSFPLYLAAYDERLFFSARTKELGAELWMADETGVRLMEDINAGVKSAYPYGFLEYDGRLYFSAYTDETGQELWVTDGASTMLAADLVPGQVDAYAEVIGAAQGALFVIAREWPGPGPEALDHLFRSDGATFIEIARFISPDDTPRFPSEVGGRVYFMGDDVTYGDEVWVIEGDSVRLVADLYSGPYGGVAGGWNAAFNDRLYFWGDDGVSGSELWAVDPALVAAEPDPAAGEGTSLRRVYPNPARDAATVEVTLGAAQPIVVEVVDVLGRRVRTVDAGPLAAGTHRLRLDTAGLAAGLYVVRLRGAATESKPLVGGQ